jgi:TRAP-type C4-dicarboxylate transport system substrate-binding protein
MGVSGTTAVKVVELLVGSSDTMGSGWLYTALKDNTIDGFIRPLIIGLGRKLDEVATNVFVVNISYFTCFLAINKDKWDRLPGRCRKFMKQVGKNVIRNKWRF